VEADRRAGSLDPDAYAVARAEGEERAARTRAALEAAEKDLPSPAAPRVARRSWRAAALIGGSLAALALIGTLLPAPVGLANGTVVNAQLAAQQQAEQERQAAIRQLEAQLAAKPQAAGLVQLAKLYLQGGTAGDYQHAADLLLLALRLDPKDADAYRLLITAYIQTADYVDATAATNAYAKVAPTSPDVPFFRGLIAYQGTGDRAAAIRWFDSFLKAAPDDARAAMVRSLRAEAAGQLPGASESPSPRPGS
jgi:cytochrome c-type biogenesis protein CcmH/NrfG